METKLRCESCGRDTIHMLMDGIKHQSWTCLVCLERRDKQMTLPGTVPPSPEQMPLIDIAVSNWRGDK